MKAADFFNGAWAARHPRRAGCVLAAMAMVAVLAFSRHGVWDTDILRLLPGDLPAVQGLARYQEHFSQSRELAFLFEWEGEGEGGEAAYDHFVEALRKEPWVERVLDGRMLSAAAASAAEARWLAALALNDPQGLPEGALEPESLRRRLQGLASRAAAGSPAAIAQLSADPLGLWSAAAARASAVLDLEGVFELAAPDGSAWIIPVAVKLQTLGEADCRALMEEVRKFLSRAEREFPAERVRVGVTGRAAYVAEIAAAMRRDFGLTSTLSAAFVLGIFWLGYRQFRLLPGIGLLLALAAGLAFACGLGLLGSLNLVAASFCSILFGVGDDFSLLIVQRHAAGLAAGEEPRLSAARAARGASGSIRAVALTTGIGFLALVGSGSPGFAQLGILVALGIGFCALLTPAFLPVFLVGARPMPGAESIFRNWVNWTQRHRGGAAILAAAVPGCCALAALVLPGRAGFDLTPRSLEPRETPAAQTLQRMMRKFPAMFEPTMVMVPEPKPELVARLDQALFGLKAAGLIQGYSSPSPLILEPERMRARLPGALELETLRAMLGEVAGELGLGAAFVEKAMGQLAALVSGVPGGAGWREILPPDSPWWFVVDRMLAEDGGTAVAYLRVSPEAGDDVRREISKLLMQEVPGVEVTGWSQMLVELEPWARKQLVVFGGGVLVAILVVLVFVYRNARDWWIHAGAMALAAVGLFSLLDILGVKVNLLNVLAFPLILGVGVDYGVHLLLAARESAQELAGTLRAVSMSALTTAGGFGALTFAQNPALSGLGFMCLAGVLWCLAAAWLVVVPGCRALSQQ